MSRLHEMTTLQKQFAEEHQDTLFRFLSHKGLPVEDYYDIVIFGYLQAVQEYDENPALSRFQFSTIAWTKMSDCLSKHFSYENKPKRKAPTVSIHTYTSDGLTLDEKGLTGPDRRQAVCNGSALLPDGNGTADGALKSRWSDLQGNRRNIFHHRTQYQRAVPPHEDASYGIKFLSRGALKT